MLSFSLVFIGFYPAQDYYLRKQLIIVFPIIITPLFVFEKKLFTFIFLVAFMAVFLVNSYIIGMENIYNHKKAYAFYKSHSDQVNAFNLLHTTVSPDKINTILWDYREHGYLINNTESIIPLYNVTNDPIIYTTNICNSNDRDCKFKEWGKIRIDYVLTKDALDDRNDLRLIQKNEFFLLYKKL
jgi:hypothetical protein